MAAHRLAWSIANGPIPPGAHVLHSCDNQLCCNPSHLSVGTHDDNMRDMAAKGRAYGARGEANHKAKLNASSVASTRERVARGETRTTIAAEFGLGLTTVRKVINRQSWRHV